MEYDVLIAGAGVTGSMLARELSRYSLSVCLIEKENDVACGASKANSGIVHGGFDPEEGTLKAKLNVEGVPLLYEAARELSVPCRNNGSLVCAFGAEEEPTVHELYERGIRNGVKEMKILTGDEARKLEPALSPEVTLALHVPTAGIICPYELTIAAAGNAMDNGVEFVRNFEITGIEKTGDGFTVISRDNEKLSGRYLVNCAGCGADAISSLAGGETFGVNPRAGEYMLLDKTEGSRVSHTVFGVPSKNGKGILVSPTVDNNLLLGPTATAVPSADNTETTADGLETVRRLALRSVPSVNTRAVITSFCGVRSSIKCGDFIVRADKKVKNLIHAAGIDSPGLTSCVAIAKMLVEVLAGEGLVLSPKNDWNGKREDPHAFRKMDDDGKNEYIKAHPDYGKIVCRCETVSEGEIRDAIRRNPKALDVDGVKRRTRSGMGRCQGGFCMPYVMRLISEENGIPMEQVTKKGGKSAPVIGKI